MGAQTQKEVLFKDLAEEILRKLRAKIIVTTEDGSYGIKGVVTDALKFILKKEKFDMIYSCGPELMMMKFYEGLSYDAIVLRTGLTHRTVYNKIHEAVETLRKKFHREGESRHMAYSIVTSLLLLHELNRR